jgi:hypothetical protein
MKNVKYFLVAISIVALITTATSYSCNPPNGDFRIKEEGSATMLNGKAVLVGTLYAEWDENNQDDYDAVTINWYHRKTDAICWNDCPQDGQSDEAVQVDGWDVMAIGFVGGGVYNGQEAGNGWSTSIITELLEALLASLVI